MLLELAEAAGGEYIEDGGGLHGGMSGGELSVASAKGNCHISGVRLGDAGRGVYWDSYWDGGGEGVG